MSQLTIRSILTTVLDTVMEGVTLAPSGQTLESMTEGMQDVPAIQCYFEELAQDPSGETDRTTFRGGVRQTNLTIHLDVYARQRSQLGEDISAVTDIADEVIAVLEAQDTKPYFGVTGLKAFSWTAQRVTFAYGSEPGQIQYAGIRFILVFRIF
jgi:hypothetical protein